MKLARQEKISYLQPGWASDPGVIAGFSTRNGGVSRQPYNSLNLGFNTDDTSHNVEGNRSTFTRAFGLESRQLLTVSQVHGTDLLVIDAPNPDLSHFLKVECDAVITDQPGIMLGILTADCYPVLMYAPLRRVVAAVHVGWRGAAAGILGKTLGVLRSSFKVFPDELKIAIGPGIGAHNYEVDRPVRDAFRQGGLPWQQCTTEVQLGKWQLDLRLACRLQLEGAGIDSRQIESAEECTCCHKELFYSYRRDAGRTGRQMGFIKLAD